MALMFQRLARNFIKNGYYPTDAETTSRILSAIEPAPAGQMRILDPCCGEGVALAEVREHLGRVQTEAFGVEYDEERAWHSKQLLDRCIHGNFQEVIVARRQFGLLFLNPPYGDLVADRSGVSEDRSGRKRLEKVFYQLSYPLLVFGGVLVLIVPHYVLDREFSTWLSLHFDHIRVYRAAEQRFKQVVVLGVRRRAAEAVASADARKRLEAAGAGEGLQELPERWCEDYYRVPASSGEAKFALGVVEPRQLADEISRLPTLWDQFDLRFAHAEQAHRRPLRGLSRWHLALALAAGQVSGEVRAADGRVYVVKGDTHKEKVTKVEVEEADNGSTREVRILTDRFVPTIRAIDFTPTSPSFGRVLTIR